MSRDTYTHHRTYTLHSVSARDAQNRAYGVELEASRKTENAPVRLDEDAMADELRATSMPAYYTTDGSLYHHGIEIVTHPCTLQYHMNKFSWKWLCQKLRKAGYRSHDVIDPADGDPMCGLHVHISRTAFGTGRGDTVAHGVAVRKLMAILTLNEKDYRKFARRPANYFCRAIDGLTLSRGMSAAEIERRLDCVPVMDHCNIPRGECRYQHVNRNNLNTVELRAFRGTLNRDTIIATLQLIDNLVIASNTWTWDQIATCTLRDVVDIHHYNELDQYMVARGLMDTVTDVCTGRRTCFNDPARA